MAETKAERLFTDCERYFRRQGLYTDWSKTEPKVVPMPRIENDHTIRGPFFVTDEFKRNFDLQKAKEKEKERKEYERDMIILLAKKERCFAKLSAIDISKKKDVKRLALLNIQLVNIDNELKRLEFFSGIKIDQLCNGTKLGRFWNKVKTKFRRGIKKLKKFFRKFQEPVLGFLSIAIPIIGSFLVKKFILRA
jgi:hypothetical protein